MTCFDNLRNQNKIIAFIVRVQNSLWYPVLFALVCTVSGVYGKQVYLPCIWGLTVCVIFSVLFSEDLKVFIVPALLIYCAVGFDLPDGYYAIETPLSRVPPFDFSSIPHFVICGSLILIALLYRFFVSKPLLKTLKQKGLLLWGILAIDAALILNGAFSPTWTPKNILYGLMIAVCLTLLYILFLSIFSYSKNFVGYLCQTLVCLGGIVTLQTMIILYRLSRHGMMIVYFGNGLDSINRSMLGLSWAVPTITGAVLAIAIPAALYMAKKHRCSLIYLLSAVTFWCMTFIINTRSAMLIGGITLFIGLILCCSKGKNKIINRIFLAFLILFIVALIVIFLYRVDNPKLLLENALDILRIDFILNPKENISVEKISSYRISIWTQGIKDFLSAPIFGVGFSSGREIINIEATTNFYDLMYHNIFIEFLGSMGIVGLFAFLLHLKLLLELFFRQASASRFLVLLVPLSILTASLFDNFFFYPNFAMIYGATLACCEIMLEEKRKQRLSRLNKIQANEKPRVLFPYVEAGKGHIVPTKTVCQVFKEKYGSSVDVIESKFFSETDDPDMQKTEVLFTKAVQQQNRSGLLSALCKIGNTLAGNTFALYVLLSMTVSGRKTNPLAVKHMEEFHAHVVYSAHWSIPYYVNQMKTPRPYTICFCPDIYSNGAFDVDCNNFLIPSQPGYRKVMNNRMYAGGNITRVPFPMRPEITNYRGENQKHLYRKKLGISDDAFVVTLCDGGYGMARLEKTVQHLLSMNKPMTLIALCGTNKALYERLVCQNTPEHIRLIPVSFTDRVLEYLSVADLFVGKSGANSMAEPAALGIPIIVTKCITYIERGIKNYYVKDLGGALYIPNAKRAARKIVYFSEHPLELEQYRKKLSENHETLYNAEATADLIWKHILELKNDL